MFDIAETFEICFVLFILLIRINALDAIRFFLILYFSSLIDIDGSINQLKKIRLILDYCMLDLCIVYTFIGIIFIQKIHIFIYHLLICITCGKITHFIYITHNKPYL